ncbi:MAG: response regulator [Calditrichota bacterium]
MADSKPIRILYMEDDHGLALLFRKKLKPLGYDIEIAPNGSEGIELVRSNEYDILIVDFNMPGYNGLEVIRILSTEEKLLPTIMLTAAGSEEVAVEALKWGAADYVAKGPGYLDRLPIVIKQTLVHHNLMLEKVAAEQALFESEATNRALLRAMPDYILQLNGEGRILSATPATQGEFHLPQSIEGKNLTDIYPPEKAEELQRLGQIALRTQKIQHFEFSLEKNDSRFFYEHRIANCEDDRILLVIRDITRRVEMEQEKEWLLQEFQDSLAKIKTLNGLIPICASCKKVRDDKGYWNRIEEYIQNHSQAEFSHGVCPACMEELYPEHMSKNKKR